VAQVYKHWYDVLDQEAVAILERWRQEHGLLEPSPSFDI
jgi:hypothetical protein